jgi:hypothetical protein
MTENPQLSIQDIAFTAKVIEVASQRGAIRADEMDEVGTVYKRLVAFVQASQPQDEEDQTEDSE